MKHFITRALNYANYCRRFFAGFFLFLFAYGTYVIKVSALPGSLF